MQTLPKKFGHNPTNPIHVNGPHGEARYINRLRGTNGKGVVYHRLGSVAIQGSENPVDVFEIVTLDGTQWGVLHFDMYHPEVSKSAPEGYTLAPTDPILDKLTFGYGSMEPDYKFPFGVPSRLREAQGTLGDKFAHRLEDLLAKAHFERPGEQLARLVTYGPDWQREDETSFIVLGETFEKVQFPGLYRMYQTSLGNLVSQLRSIADAWHGGNVAAAAQALESDLGAK